MVDDQAQRSPDGGPLSQAHLFLKPQALPTMRVKFKEAPKLGVVEINRSDFNPKLHTEAAGAEKKTERVRLPTDLYGSQTRDELLLMTIEELKKLKEWEDVDNQKLTKKEDIVDAILEVRGE